MKEKKVEERAAAPAWKSLTRQKGRNGKAAGGSEKSRGKTQRAGNSRSAGGRPRKANKDKDAAPKSKAPAQKPEKAVKRNRRKNGSNDTGRSRPKGPESQRDAPRRGKEQIVYIKLNELHAFKNHRFEVRDDEEMRAMVSSVKDKGVTRVAGSHPMKPMMAVEFPVLELYRRRI